MGRASLYEGYGMRVLLIASEMTPFARTGGLADVMGMLPGALANEGVVADAILPCYEAIERHFDLKPTGITFTINMAGTAMPAEVLSHPLGYGAGTAWFIKNNEYYGRSGIYGDEHGDFEDNCERFIFFCRAAIEAAHHLNVPFEVIHCCDWQTGLVPVYQHVYSYGSDVLRNARSVFNIHNLAYQGVFWHWDWPLTGLDWSLFNWQGLEYYGKINFMKGGIMFADAITVVSKSYSREIQTPEFGCGLDGVFRYRSDALHGILTGLDTSVWDPANDPALPARFSVQDLSGKQVCRKALLDELHLDADGALPVICMAGELQESKGIDLVLECLDELLALPACLVFAGTGRRRRLDGIAAAVAKHPGRAVFREAPDAAFVRRLYAGADMCLVPSRFEPAGISQLRGLRYGAVPVASAAGGLADTVGDFTPEGLDRAESTGFVIMSHNATTLVEEVEHAVRCFHSPDIWNRLVRNAMMKDFSFQRGASLYKELYAKTCSV